MLNIMGLKWFSIQKHLSGVWHGNLINDPNKVVFPAPLGPKSPKILPLGTSIETSFKAL